MARIKRGNVHTRKRTKLLAQAKGFRGGRKNLVRQASSAVFKAGQRAYDHRKLKKRTARATWQIKINAGVRAHNLSYSRFIDALTKKNIAIDRKILAHLAEYKPKIFEKIIAFALQS